MYIVNLMIKNNTLQPFFEFTYSRHNGKRLMYKSNYYIYYESNGFVVYNKFDERIQFARLSRGCNDDCGGWRFLILNDERMDGWDWSAISKLFDSKTCGCNLATFLNGKICRVNGIKIDFCN